MKILLINGTNRKSSTYNTARTLIDKINTDKRILEIFLPNSLSDFCTGCGNCFLKGEEFCPHYEQVKDIAKKIDWADLVIFATPVYAMHTTGQMKTLLDHLAYNFLIHRPMLSIFKKQAVVLSTCCGGGTKTCNKDITDSLDQWGMGRVLTYGKSIYAMNYSELSKDMRLKLSNDMAKLSKKIIIDANVKPRIKVRLYYRLFKFINKKTKGKKLDYDYWQKHHLFDKKPF